MSQISFLNSLDYVLVSQGFSLLSPSRPLQVCELVKFMIESCQRILGEDPASLFGGPPLRLDTDEMGSGTEATGDKCVRQCLNMSPEFS